VDGFQVMAVNGRPYNARSLQDTVTLPAGGTVRIRMRFGDFVGAFVYHCHILAHEDAGMMAVVEVTRTGRGPTRRTVRALRAMAAAMHPGPTAKATSVLCALRPIRTGRHPE
jgi:hypothetical protein